MNAQPFPIIGQIAPLLAAIDGMPEFKVVRRDAYITIDYLYVRAESFGSLLLDPPGAHDAIRLRREARGIKFTLDGAVLARPFHKFFNLGEKPETQPHVLPWRTPHVILDKLDGSMIHPLWIDETVRWATRNGETEQAALAARHMGASGLSYEPLARDLMRDGLTPLFEFVGPDNRIVVKYERSQALLLAVRRMDDGFYLDDAELRRIGDHYGVPVVHAWGSDVGAVDEFVAHTRGLSDAEGYVVRFADGTTVKLKAEAYALRHAALSDIASEKFALRLALEGGEDDIVALLPPALASDLVAYAGLVRAGLRRNAAEIEDFARTAKAELQEDRKAYAERVNTELAPDRRGAAFKAWEGDDAEAVLRTQLLRATATFDRIDEVRHLIGGARWSAGGPESE